MNPKVIKSDNEYRESRSEIERLAVMDISPDTEDGARLELLALLVEEYEKRHFPFEAPDPIEAIQFRMNEQGLRQSDLVPYLGSRSRVSEVLARKRPLTVQMIRELSRGLGIPADLLLAPIGSEGARPLEETTPQPIDWSKFPVSEMARHGYFTDIGSVKPKVPAHLAQKFFSRVFPTGQPASSFARRGLRGEAVTSKSEYALLAWKARVVFLARRRKLDGEIPPYHSGYVDQTFLQQVVGLSWHPNGIRLARQLVEGIGIPVVVESHLLGTHLDGAAILDEDGTPIIGLTLRMDRVDHFWFTLLHELAHVSKHLSAPGDSYMDRLEDKESTEAAELEANRIARDALVPRAVWRRSEIAIASTRERILKVAAELKIHPAIVAGRVRRETGDFTAFGDLLGQNEVQRLFPDVFFER